MVVGFRVWEGGASGGYTTPYVCGHDAGHVHLPFIGRWVYTDNYIATRSCHFPLYSGERPNILPHKRLSPFVVQWVCCDVCSTSCTPPHTHPLADECTERDTYGHFPSRQFWHPGHIPSRRLPSRLYSARYMCYDFKLNINVLSCVHFYEFSALFPN